MAAATDARMMAIALRMAKRGLGTTAPNPSVGAVILDEATGEVVARGWTQPGGRPHAEPEAIARAGARARGATIYVTLEPCSHFGKTPPCADTIIAAGIARAVVGIEDPDPRVAGRGLDRLRGAGIAVTRGVLAEEAHWLTRGHIVRVTERRPFVQLKMALSSEGTIAHGSQGRPVWVTGPEARMRGHLLRAEADAILVGRQTVRDDDPELTCRLPGLAHRTPVRVVLARNAEALAASTLARSARGCPVWIFTGPETSAAAGAALEALGVRVFRVAVIGGFLWLPAVMEALVAEGVTRLLVEGGATMWRAFSAAGLVDEVVLFHARAHEPEAFSERAAFGRVARFVDPGGLVLTEVRNLPTDRMLVFRRLPKTRSPRAVTGQT